MTTDNTSWSPGEVARLRAQLRRRREAPYERLGDSDQLNQKSEAHQIVDEGWQFAAFPRISVVPPIAWDDIASENRSWEFRLHSWDFLGPPLCVLDREADERLLSYVVRVAEDWAESHSALDIPSRMAWYDMAVGLRAYRLAFIVDRAARSGTTSVSSLRTLLQSARLHQDAFSREGTFNARSNHGLYVAAGQKAMSMRLAPMPGMDAQREQADLRLREMVSTQFTSEGVHREHSPDYHRMILSTMRRLDRFGLIPQDSSVDVEEMEEALAWFVLPDRSLAMFGDTPLRILPARDGYTSPILQYAATGGKFGRPPEVSWRAFRQSGYVVYRSGWPARGDDPADWTYLALNAAFHSRTHKHADDLSFVWYDRRSRILVDPGRFGYLDPTDADSDLGKKGFYYAHPKRIYVEETRAHNAVDIDKQSYQRRGVDPYGSAITRAGEQNGVFFAEAHAEHLTLDRSFRIQHTRLLMLRAGEWLIVVDRLWDPRNHPHQFRQWFQFAPHLEVAPDDIGWTVKSPDGWRLWGVPLLGGTTSGVMSGEREPELQGWISYEDNEFDPTPSVYLSHKGASATLATLFSFSETAPAPGHSTISDERLDLSWLTDRHWDLSVELNDETEKIGKSLVIRLGKLAT